MWDFPQIKKHLWYTFGLWKELSPKTFNIKLDNGEPNEIIEQTE